MVSQLYNYLHRAKQTDQPKEQTILWVTTSVFSYYWSIKIIEWLASHLLKFFRNNTIKKKKNQETTTLIQYEPSAKQSHPTSCENWQFFQPWIYKSDLCVGERKTITSIGFSL